MAELDRLKPDQVRKVLKERWRDNPAKEKNTYLSIVFCASALSILVTHKLNAGPGVFIGSEVVTLGLGLYAKTQLNMLARKSYDSSLDEREGVNISKEGELGRNKMITADSFEEDKAFKKALPSNIRELNDTIIGKKDGYLYMKKKEMNYNYLVVGIPGSGKTVCLNFPIIMQALLNGHSVIVTDPKLETYNKTAALARAYGHEVKVFICDPDFLRFSDGCNLMGFLRELAQDPTKSVIEPCDEFVKAIIDNTTGDPLQGDKDFWVKQENNLLTAIVRALAVSKRYECTLEQVYKLLLKPLGEFISEMNAEIMGEENHPSQRPWMTFINQDPVKVGSQIYSSIGTRLKFLDSPAVRRILSTDDIDLTLPGKKPCIYYIGASYIHHSLDVIMSMFFTMMFQQLASYALSLPEQTLPVRVKMLLDELKNIGRIPDMPGKLSTVRSQNIDILMILQGLDQLETMYPNGEHRGILNPCELQILLSTNDYDTADYFSKMSGEMTQVVESERYSQNIRNVLGIHPEKQITSQMTQSQVMTVGDVRTMGCDTIEREMLIIPAKHNAIRLETYYYQTHPLFQIMEDVNFQSHHPVWWADIDEDEAAMFGLTREQIEGKDKWPEIEPLSEDEIKNYNAGEYIKNWQKWCAQNSQNENVKICIRESEIKKRIREDSHNVDWDNFNCGLV